MQFKLESVKADAYVHQQGFEEAIEKLDLKGSVRQYAETAIHYSQCNAILDMIDIISGLDDSQREELKDNFKAIENNLKRLEALMNRLY
jgi:hypothetical protein